MRYQLSRRKNSSALTLFLAVFFGAALFAPNAFAAANYGAEIVDVLGKVSVTLKADGATVEAAVGQRLGEGDAIETGADGEAEILFDDGNVTRMDENSKITIEKLSMEDDKSRKSVLGLAFGRVKNSVIKLVHKESSFEVRTKSAVAGVRGTPHWVVGAFEGRTHKTEVDLLGTTGEKGSVFVKGSDAGKTEVLVKPGMRTVAEFGLPPLEPFVIAPDRKIRLGILMPIKTEPAKSRELRDKILEEVREEVEEKPEQPAEEEKREEPGEEEEGLVKPAAGSDEDEMMEHVTRVVSVGEILDPNKDEECEECAKPGSTSHIDDEVTPSSPSTTIRLNLTYQ
ncbi:MAG: FecR domain-containing protein [Nitrospinota bacterium]